MLIVSKRIHLLLVNLLIAILFVCNGCSVRKSYTDQFLGKVSFQVLSDNVSINNEAILPGREIKIDSGENEIAFNGEVILKEVVARENSNSGNGCNNGLAFVIFMPICVLTGMAGAISSPIVNYVPALCNAKSVINTESGHKYVVEVRENSSNSPLLVIYRRSSPSFVIEQKIMTCKKIEKET